MAQLGFGHAAVESKGAYENDVVDPGLGGHVQHRFHDPLAVVGSVHGGQRQGDVVEGDGQAHTREQQLRQRFAVTEWVQQGVPDGVVGILEGLDRFGRVDDPGAAGREPLEPEPLAVPGEDRRGRSIYVEDETGTGHGVVSSLSSLLVAQIEGHLHRPPPPGLGGVLDGFGVAVERVGGAHQPLEAGVVDQFHRQRRSCDGRPPEGSGP